MTVIKLGPSQEGQPVITSKVENVEKMPKAESAEKLSSQDAKCVTLVASTPDNAFALPPPPPPVASVASSFVATTVSGIPLLPPPPGPTKSRTAGNNHQVLRKKRSFNKNLLQKARSKLYCKKCTFTHLTA